MSWQENLVKYAGRRRKLGRPATVEAQEDAIGRMCAARLAGRIQEMNPPLGQPGLKAEPPAR